MPLRLSEIRDLAYRFVPVAAADYRLYDSVSCSWWPAHEIGHFLVATPAECRERQFGLDAYEDDESKVRYVIAKEIAATSISQRLLRRSGQVTLADEEIEYTDEWTIECSFERWCKRSVERLIRANKALRLPATAQGLEALLTRKACEVGTAIYPSRRAAERAAERQAISRPDRLVRRF